MATDAIPDSERVLGAHGVRRKVSAEHRVTRERLLRQSLFPPGSQRFALLPTTDGYPDVDTYRDLELYLIARP